MIKRADAIFDGGPLRPLELFELEERERIASTIATLDDEFQREFGTPFVEAQGQSGEACGPRPWGGFLDLNTL